jgi:signal transduction histidine kinase
MIGIPLPEMNPVTADNYASVVSQRVAAERLTLAGLWLSRLNELLIVRPNEVFPSDSLLDHIPTLIAEIASYLRAPADEEIAANAAVIDKARELGMLRHDQRASVHQLLREYEILGELLEAFVVEETERLGLKPTAQQCFELLRRLTHAARTLMRTTVDTFVSEYTTTIQERNERIKSFNRMASHELRTPIGTLMFASAMLRQPVVQRDPQRFERVVSTISSNTERLSHLVTNLERLTRLTDVLDVPSQQETDLHALAVEVARQLEDMAASRSVTIRVDASFPPVVVDSARLELVVLNLVSNAIKYCDPDKPERWVEIAADHNDGAYALSVRDNGLGIPDSDQAAIFDRFFRAHSHLDGELGVSGTGLGLAIVAECVRELGASIACQSTPGEGSAFVVQLPSRPPIASQTPDTPDT